MRLERLFILAIAVAAGTAIMAAPQLSPTRPWPPAVRSVPPGSPPLSPADALNTFTMPTGYHVELVASEPLVQDPIAMDWDVSGRLWVVEMPGFVPNLSTPEPNPAAIGRVVVLEDTNHDGRMDRRTVFADHLVLARAIKVIEHGVLVGEPPNLWLMHDTNGDLRADTKELVTSAYGRRDGRVEQNASSLYWATDNHVYTSNSDIDLEWTHGSLETHKTLSRGEWGVTEDDGGHVYRNSNESVLHVDLVPTDYYARNPGLLRTRGSYEPLDGDNGDANVVWPARPNPGTNRAYQAGIDRPDGSLAKFTSACAPMVYRGDRLPAELEDNVFVADPAANLVSRLVVTDDGTSLRGRKAYAEGEFLSSTDERFRPVFLSNGPDGTFYVVDMYRGVIQQRADITEYLRDQIVNRRLETPTSRGRIYRVVHDGTARDTTPPFTSRATPAQLVSALAHPNGWWRDAAERMLVERGDRSVAPALAALVASAPDPRTRLHALWALNGLDAVEPSTAIGATADPSRDVRAAAVRVSERWLGDASNPVRSAVLAAGSDPDWAVRDQVAASLGSLPANERAPIAAAFLAAHAGDPVALDATLSGLRGSEIPTIEHLMARGAESDPERDSSITMLAAIVMRDAEDTSLNQIFSWIADETRPVAPRSALLRGAEVALLNAPMPGTPERRGGTAPIAALPAPCATCPGGRAGPGGAYAFPQAPAALGPGPAGRGGPMLRLGAEPVSLSHVAADGGVLSERAARVLARIGWPGKPGLEAFTPLTAAEQTRFDNGREVYRNVCQTCHQPDGRGQDTIAATLIGSELALAPPDVTARILLNGKEGPIGLMPPVGQTLSDEQIADVLTYVRRAWGQTGSPVAPGTVTAVRALTAARAKPWTNDELRALAAGNR